MDMITSLFDQLGGILANLGLPVDEIAAVVNPIIEQIMALFA